MQEDRLALRDKVYIQGRLTQGIEYDNWNDMWFLFETLDGDDRYCVTAEKIGGRKVALKRRICCDYR